MFDMLHFTLYSYIFSSIYLKFIFKLDYKFPFVTISLSNIINFMDGRFDVYHSQYGFFYINFYNSTCLHAIVILTDIARAWFYDCSR